jgi:SARP family transcriptional regulator, regulator of embCAB operon
MRFKVLGPLWLSGPRATQPPKAPKQRKLLALLVLYANSVVTADECVDELWGEEPPPSAASTLHTYIMQIRKALDRGGLELIPRGERLVTVGRGYSLAMEQGELDLQVFQDLAEEGRRALAEQDDARAAELLGQALALWRGPALVDVPAGPILRTKILGLNELRLSTLEDRIDADLRLGRHRQLLSELSMLVEHHPLHENFSAQLMIALYRSGRSTDALRVYQRLYRMLAEEFGIEPSRALRCLQQAVLRSDPKLDLREAPEPRRGDRASWLPAGRRLATPLP